MMRRRLLYAALLLYPLAAQAFLPPEREAGLDGKIHEPPYILQETVWAQAADLAAGDETWSRFTSRHGEAWWVRTDLRTDRPALVWGEGIQWLGGLPTAWGSAPLQGGEQRARLAELETLARGFLARNPEILRVDPSRLRLSGERSLSALGGRIWSVEFDYLVDGVPVEGAQVFFRLNSGRLVQFGTRHVADTVQETSPSIPAEDALERAVSHLALASMGEVEPRDAGTLVLLPVAEHPRVYEGEPGRGLDYRLVWRLSFRVTGELETWTAHIDARTGEVVHFWDANVYQCNPATLSQGKVTGGIYPVSPDDAEVVRPMPYNRIREDGNTKSTDFNGVYPWDGGTSVGSFHGTYFDVNCVNCANPREAYIEDSLTGDLPYGTGGSNFDGNGISTRAERNTFYHLTYVRSLAAKWLDIAWFNTQPYANVNYPAACNAMFDGSGFWFFAAGGNCRNFGEVSGVVQHEWGHGLDFNTGYNNDGARGEGVGDIVAILTAHDSRAGVGSMTSGGGIRQLDEALSGLGLMTVSSVSTACNSGGGPMGGEVHCEGQVYGQAQWHLIQNLLNDGRYGEIAAWYQAERLFFASMGPAGTYIPDQATSVYDAYILVDDDNGNLADGTPNADLINEAFEHHEMASSPQAIASAPCTPPAGPATTGTPLIDLNNGISQVLVEWADLGPGFTYNVYRNTRDATAPYQMIAADVAVPSWLDTEVTNGLTYNYLVQAVRAADACVSVDDNQVEVTVDLPEVSLAGVTYDDSIGGNGNFVVEPGEMVEVPLTLANSGGVDASNTTVRVVSVGTGAVVIQGNVDAGVVPATGQITTSAPNIILSIDPDQALCGELIEVVVAIVSDIGCWSDAFGIVVGGGRAEVAFQGLVIEDLGPIANGNGSADPGEELALRLTLENLGPEDATGIEATITPVTAGVAATDGRSDFADAPASGTADTLDPHFTVTVGTDPVLCGGSREFDVIITAAEGCWKDRFTLPLGTGASRVPLYFDDFEGADDNGWTHDALTGTDTWERGFPGITTGNDPYEPVSGENVWGTNLGGFGDRGVYEASSNAYLDSPRIDTSGYDRIVVGFDQYLTAESREFDQALFMVNGNIAWENPSGNNYFDLAWTRRELDVTEWIGPDGLLQARFMMISDPGLELGGWNIDDFTVEGLVCELPEPRPMLTVQAIGTDDGQGIGMGNGDGVLDPGEVVRLSVDLGNVRNLTARDVTGRLRLMGGPPGVTLMADTAVWPDIAPVSTETSLAPHFILMLPSDPDPCGATLDLELQVDYSDGTDDYALAETFSLEIGDWVAGTGAPERVFFDDMEAPGQGANGWIHWRWANQDDWMRLEPPSGHQYDPDAAYSGTRVWGNDLVPFANWNGNYAGNSWNWLGTPVIDLSRHTDVTFRFQRWLTVQDGTADQARVYVNQTELWVNPDEGTGNHTIDTEWSLQEFDVSADADGNPAVQFFWELRTNANAHYGGWNIDDVEVVGVPMEPSCDLYDCQAAPPDPFDDLRLERDGGEVVLQGSLFGGNAAGFLLFREPIPADLQQPLMGQPNQVLATGDYREPLPAERLMFYRLVTYNECGDRSQ